MTKKIMLKINGKEIAMNAFVQNIFIKIINGMVDSLSGVSETKKRIELTIIEEER